MDEKLLVLRAEEYLSRRFGTSKMYMFGGNAVEVMADFATEETKLLSEHILELQKDKGKLTDENKEAREIIKNLLRVTYGEGWNYSLDVKVLAEQFLGDEK